MYDTIVVGAGLSGLTTAAFLAKKGLKVCVLEQHVHPGGSSGAFRRGQILYDQGNSMFFGFGEKGFNPLRHVMNVLEEDITVVRHPVMYRMHYAGQDIVFYADLDRFIHQLEKIFPGHGSQIRNFYKHIHDLYDNLFSDMAFISPSEMKREEMLKTLKKDPIRQLKLLRYLRVNTETILRRFITSKDLLTFFNKLTSTYCYTTIRETPAILSVTMFVDNHVGGTYYPLGSSRDFVCRIEKAAEKFGADFFYGKHVRRFMTNDDGVCGVVCKDGSSYEGRTVVYSGAVKNVFDEMLPDYLIPKRYMRKIKNMEDSYPSLVFYSNVKKSVIPQHAYAIEMFCPHPEIIDESEITVYVPSLTDDSICPEGTHILIALGPSLKTWPARGTKAYKEMKKQESERMIGILDKYYPGYRKGLIHSELSTPRTIERYCGKPNGSVAGPKQMMGQELLRRPHAESPIANLFFCGESTTMGTGAPSVCISGMSAANVILRKFGMTEYGSSGGENRHVSIVSPQTGRQREKNPCQGCLKAPCNAACPWNLDVRGIMRRKTVENEIGILKIMSMGCADCSDMPCVTACPHNVDFSFMKQIKDQMRGG